MRCDANLLSDQIDIEVLQIMSFHTSRLFGAIGRRIGSLGVPLRSCVFLFTFYVKLFTEKIVMQINISNTFIKTIRQRFL